MKKVVILLFFFCLLNSIIKSNQEYIIPNDAIRLRVIANSNTLSDQATKVEIKNNIESILVKNINSFKTMEEASSKIQEDIPEIKEMINHYNLEYKINYGSNYFPEKTYKGIQYPAGYYESLVVTLGSGKGDNWWCLLFPPLCYIDDNSMQDNEYKSIVKDLVHKYM